MAGDDEMAVILLETWMTSTRAEMYVLSLRTRWVWSSPSSLSNNFVD